MIIEHPTDSFVTLITENILEFCRDSRKISLSPCFTSNPEAIYECLVNGGCPEGEALQKAIKFTDQGRQMLPQYRDNT